MGEHLSPVVLRKLTDLATRLGSFAAASDSLEETLEIDLNTKRVERQTERIGAERALAIAAWDQLPLREKLAAPPGVKVPDVVCIECDGGRIQRCDLPADAKSHWTETKMGLLLERFYAGSLSERPVETDHQTSEVFGDFGDFGSLWVRELWSLAVITSYPGNSSRSWCGKFSSSRSLTPAPLRGRQTPAASRADE